MKNQKITLQKFKVCQDCWSVGITDNQCICTYEKNYPTIELEFEVCKCCNHLINEGNPAETEFNKKQLESFNLI